MESMADNFLERQRRDYEEKKAGTARRPQIRSVKEILQRARQNFNNDCSLSLHTTRKQEEESI